jgi:hypothetical protein
MKYIITAACGLVLYPFCVFCQSGVPNLSGIWRRNPQTNSGSSREMLVRIEQNGQDVIITFRARNGGAEETNIQRLHVGSNNDANELHGAPMTSRSSWDGKTLVVDSIAKFADQELRLNDRWTLSPDGRTLSFVARHQFGAEPSPTEEASVFDLQPDDSWNAQPSSKLAEEAYPNIEILKGMPAQRLPAIMAMFSRSLGAPCTHCHVEGAMDKSDKAQFAKAREMFRMRNWIAQNAKIESTCWTCHRGNPVPAAGPQIDTSLWPVGLELPAEQGAHPASKVYKNLKFLNSKASDLKSSMLFISASLGVGCSHCHVAGEWEKDDKPAKNVARSMLAMVRDTRREFTNTRMGCPSCHHGATRPETAP